MRNRRWFFDRDWWDGWMDWTVSRMRAIDLIDEEVGLAVDDPRVCEVTRHDSLQSVMVIVVVV